MSSFSSREKWQLFLSLYKHGTNIDALKTSLPEYSAEQIKLAINHYRYKADRARTNLSERLNDHKMLNNLNEWKRYLDHCHSLEGTYIQKRYKNKFKNAKVKDQGNYTDVLSKAMLYAACFENHYQSDDLEKPNYSEIYRYLSQIVVGNEPTQLCPGSARKVLEMIGKLNSMVENPEYQKFRDAFTAALPKKTKKVHSDHDSTANEEIPLFQDINDISTPRLNPDDPYYEVKKEEVLNKLNEENFKIATKLLQVPGFNPLHFSPELMIMPHNTTKENKPSMAAFWARFKKLDQPGEEYGYNISSIVEDTNDIEIDYACDMDEKTDNKHIHLDDSV